MNKQSIAAIGVMVAVAAGWGLWKYKKSKKDTEVSVVGEITDSDKSAKPSQAQCAKYSEELVHYVPADRKDMTRSTKGGAEAICLDKFSIATLKCIRAGNDKGDKVTDEMDPYGCVAAHPRK